MPQPCQDGFAPWTAVARQRCLAADETVLYMQNSYFFRPSVSMMVR
jgi:hypothetical protein